MSKIIPLTKGVFAVVDEEDYERLTGFTPQITTRNDTPKTYRWYFSNNGGAYATYGGRINKTHVAMHRLIMNAPDHLEVDHINGNRLDNRKENLRLATRSENQRNTQKSKRGITSKYKGVCYDKKQGQYKAEINGKFLGYYNSELVAATAYDKAANEMYGKFAKCNFPDEEYALLWEEYGKQIENRKRTKGSINRTSKYKGVSKDKRRGGWVAYADVNGKRHSIGRYDNEDKAYEARTSYLKNLS